MSPAQSTAVEAVMAARVRLMMELRVAVSGAVVPRLSGAADPGLSGGSGPRIYYIFICFYLLFTNGGGLKLNY